MSESQTVIVTDAGITFTRLGWNSTRPTVATCVPPISVASARTPVVIAAAT